MSNRCARSSALDLPISQSRTAQNEQASAAEHQNTNQVLLLSNVDGSHLMYS